MLRLWIAALAVAAASPALAQRPRHASQKPAFSASPAELRQLFDDLETQPGDDVAVALEEGTYRFDKRGNWVFTLRRIYKVLDAGGVQGWGYTAATYAPWYQKRPELRARVIGADGSASPLDPSSISVAPARSGAPHTYSDSRQIRAPLPGIEVGAVVEEQIVKRTTAPFFAAGDVFNFVVDQTVPIGRVRLVIDAPSRLRLRFASRGPVELDRRRRRRRGRTVWTFSATDVERRARFEPLLPASFPRLSYLSFSVGRSWKRVATSYGKLVDRQIRAGPVPELVARVPRYDGSNRDEVVASALALVNDNVRYTGLELGQAAIVPWTPAETWRRKYGDCKDKATLLVALLRGAGLRADPALLNAGTGLDIAPKLPGLGGFDHVIVAVSSGPTIWIDPTSELARAGQLPRSDQGRWALLASSRTRRPVRTPIEPSTANRTVERRDIALAESGPARVVETTRWSGGAELRFRYDFRATKPADLEERMANYAERVFGAQKLDKLDHGDPEDLATPLTLRLEMAEADYLTTDRDKASVWVLPNAVLNELPEYLTKKDDDAEPRLGPLQLVPMSKQVTYRATIPPGFRVRSLPEPVDESIGPLKLTVAYRKSARAVTAVVELDTGDGRFSPKQADRLRERLTELNGASYEIAVEQIGHAELSAGRIKNAIDEYRRLIKLHPKEALHHFQLARALIKAGLGRPARQSARRAVALEPKSAEAVGVLGWVLHHDELGRAFMPGWDRREAIAAHRRAIKLDPDQAWLRGNLALALACNGAGDPWEGDLDAAISALRALRRQTDDKTYDGNLLQLLWMAGRFGEIEKEARGMEANVYNHVMRVAAAAALGGEKAMKAKLAGLGRDANKRGDIMNQVLANLIMGRRYKLAHAAARHLGEVASVSAQRRAQLAPLATFKAIDGSPYPAADPRSAIAALVLSFERGTLRDSARRHLTRRGVSLKELEAGELLATLTQLRRAFQSRDVPDAVVTDTVLALWRFKKQTLAGGSDLQLSAEVNGNSVLGKHYYTIRSRGRHRLLATSESPAGVGAHAIGLLERGKVAGARAWLEAVAQGGADEHLPFFEVYKAIGKEAGRRELTFAAAALAAGDAELARAALARLRRCPKTPEALARGCGRAVVRAHLRRKSWARAFATAERLAEKWPSDFYVLQLALVAAQRARRPGAVKTYATRLKVAAPKNWLARQSLIVLDARRGDHAAARARLVAMAKNPSADWLPLNLLAWIGLFTGDIGDDTVRAGQRALARSTAEARAAVLNTLAAVRAARGELSDARERLLETLEVRATDEILDADWLVHGRIAAGYGFPDEARRAYRQLAKPERRDNMSSYDLAQRWLKEL